MVKIKLCGLVEPEMAYQAAILGADFIGLIFHAPSKRAVSLPQAKEISQAVRLAGAIPVAVFTSHTAAEMQDICIHTQIDTIQLHGAESKKQHSLLPENYSRIFALSGSEQAPSGLNPQRDFLLFDHFQPGSGLILDWENFSYIGEMKYGLAGGLRAENVSTAITKTKPYFVDVSSGIENHQGKKTLLLIEQFIRAVKSSPSPYTEAL